MQAIADEFRKAKRQHNSVINRALFNELPFARPLEPLAPNHDPPSDRPRRRH